MPTITDQIRNAAIGIQRNGPRGLAGLYDLAAQRLLRYSLQITRNQHDAEDALQATMSKVMTNPSVLIKADAPWPYLLTMCRNESVLILRRRRPWAMLTAIADLLTSSPVDEIEQDEQNAAVWIALRALPAAQREVVVLKVWENLTFAEISQVLGMPAATAASRYRYAIEKLGRLLRKEYAEVHDG